MILFKFPISRKLSILSNPKIDGFVKSPISALRFFLGISRTAKYAAFLGISRALILNFLLCRPKLTFYECIIFLKFGFSRKAQNGAQKKVTGEIFFLFADNKVVQTRSYHQIGISSVFKMID